MKKSLDPSTIEAAHRGFDKQGFMQLMGAKLTKIAYGHCEIELPFDPKLTQHHGVYHGGAVATMADTAAGFAAYSVMTDGRQPLTIEFKINLLAAASGGDLIARSDVLRAGRSVIHLRSDVFARQDGEEQHVATALVSMKSTKAVAEK